jgi:hypothetical protein
VSNDPVVLDSQRGMAAQKATELRRLLADVKSNEAALRARQTALETQLTAAPAATWQEAAEKARYLLAILADSPAGSDPCRRRLIDAVNADFDRLGDAGS